MDSTASIQKLAIGSGIYSVPDIARVLSIPVRKVRRYIDDMLNERSGKKYFNESYSWRGKDNHIFVSFPVLIELFCIFRLHDEGLSVRKILTCREQMIKDLGAPYPFAHQELLTDGKEVWFRYMDDLVKADGKRQIAFRQLIEPFAGNIEFDTNHLAVRLWPMGKASSVVLDPHHQFGQPVIHKTNVQAETLYDMHRSGEGVRTLSILYDLTEKEVKDALWYFGIAA